MIATPVTPASSSVVGSSIARDPASGTPEDAVAAEAERWQRERMQFWQSFAPRAPGAPGAAWTDTFDATMPDGTALVLPLRDLGETAVAGLIVNQASFAVLDRLVEWLALIARRHAPDVVVGLPTLGHVVGAAVARALGHANWVAPGTSQKFWYEETLSVPLASVTSPGAGRRMWLDPRLVPRLQERRVLLVDDVVSTGASLRAGLDLLATVGIRPVAVAACMVQGSRWQAVAPADLTVEAVFATPLFHGTTGEWTPIEGSAATSHCPLVRSIASAG